MNYSQMNKLNEMVYQDKMDPLEAAIHLLPMNFAKELEEIKDSEFQEEWNCYHKYLNEAKKNLMDAYILRDILKGLGKEGSH